jgi:hypothetical protein
MTAVVNHIQDGYEKEGAPPRSTPELWTDNEVMLKQLKKGVLPQVQRLAQFKMPIVHQHYNNKSTIFDKVYTKENSSDILTKLVNWSTFIHLLPQLTSNIEAFKKK